MSDCFDDADRCDDAILAVMSKPTINPEVTCGPESATRTIQLPTLVSVAARGPTERA